MPLPPFEAASPAGPVPTPPRGHTWEGLMDMALVLAREAEQEGEVPVGALVIARDGTILGEGRNAPCRENDPTAHAEMRALQTAGKALGNYRLEDCVLVVTLEPCAMCAQAMVHARLAGCVYGAVDRQAGAALSALDLFDLPFQNHRVWHMGGVRGEECADLLLDFFKKRR